MSLADQVCQHGEVILLVRDGMPNQPVAAGTVQSAKMEGVKCMPALLPTYLILLSKIL